MTSRTSSITAWRGPFTTLSVMWARLWNVRDGKEYSWLLESSSVTVKIVNIRSFHHVVDGARQTHR